MTNVSSFAVARDYYYQYQTGCNVTIVDVQIARIRWNVHAIGH